MTRKLPPTIKITTDNGREIHAPTIHLNGTSADQLIDAYMTAAQAIQKALDALREATPNGRDYYPQGEDAERGANLDHRARNMAINNVRLEMLALAEHVANTRGAR